MSKSLGNSPDPLDIIAEYGADALRFAIMKTAPLGADIRFEITNEGGKEIYPQVVEGRNFANKLWNAVRYRQMQGDEAAGEWNPDALSIYSIDILAKLDDTEKKMKAAYEDYRFNELAQLLYEFWWSQYCDWYLESAKGDFMEGADPASRAATLATMDRVLKRFLMLLHPYMPHITEELWSTLNLGDEGGPEFLMLTPVPDTSVLDGLDPKRVAEARAKVSAIYEGVSRARNLKAEYGVGGNRDVKIIIDPEATSFDETEVFAQLAGAGEIVLDPGHKAEKGVPAALTGIGKIYLPLDGLIDVDAERERLTR